jgi:hypothetical protein
MGKLYISLKRKSQIKINSVTPLDNLLFMSSFDCLVRTPVLAQLECSWVYGSQLGRSLWDFEETAPARYCSYQHLAKSSSSGSLSNSRRTTLSANRYDRNFR